ncbi:hypothetical protein HYP84_gp117 [Shigella phage MK-13]|uniref:Uncharacterized protein n=1 Tax=Shigella phage MK-13 TaxID=2530042 RepID=A0A513QBW3_9CAUD|nr:hypothetical protein HYP84_gp117 [Shigella phage MK-13]QBJ04414.1 hypothetical protein MK13_00185 [Shigella phage MK-13]UHS64933.1 hypothetical protein GLOOB_86 [Shigella phage vB_SboS_Gloob]
MSLEAYNREFSEINYGLMFAREKRFIQASEYLERHGMVSEYKNKLNMKAAMASVELGADCAEAQSYSRQTDYDQDMVEEYKSILFRTGWINEIS